MRPFKRTMGLILAGSLLGLCSGQLCAEEYTISDLGAPRKSLLQQTAAMKRPMEFRRGLPLDVGLDTCSGLNNSGHTIVYLKSSGHEAIFSPDGSLTDLGTAMDRVAINNSGEVAGTSTGSLGEHRAVIFKRGVTTDLGAQMESASSALNDAGQVTGVVYTSAGIHAFLYSRWTLTDLGTLGGDYSYGRDLNNAGQVTGDSTTPSGGAPHAFLYSGGTMTDLGTLGGDYSSGWSINAAGQVVGGASTGDQAEHAFLYSDGSMKDLGTSGEGWSIASGINNAGQIVGFAGPGGTDLPRAFLYSSGVMTDLTGLLPGDSEWATLNWANAINDSGEILGLGKLKTGEDRCFLMKPRR